MKIAIGIATTGRRETLTEIVADLAAQTRRPDAIVIQAAAFEDVDPARLRALGLPVEIAIGGHGSSVQRNAILERLDGFDAVLFIDDDFVLRPDYLAALERCLERNADVVVVTGMVLADGARNAGVPLDAARAIIAASAPVTDPALEELFSAYGCNMAVRLAPVAAHGLRFNENLPLYGWLEDMDLSRQMARYGRVVRTREAQGVHLAVKRGRVSGLRFGYSQIANPVDLYRSGLIPFSKVLSHAGRNLLSNALYALAPEPHIDRRGRLRGNLIAVGDLLRGRLTPQAILNM